MQALILPLTLCALQLCPAVLGGPPQQRFVLGNGWPFRLTRVRNFSWQNCVPSDPALVRSLSVSPDPICIPGDVTLACSGTTTTGLVSPIKIVVVLEKRLGSDMWIRIPCVDQFGSCTYDDMCPILDELVPPGQACPEPLITYGIPCHCPFKAGTYNLPPSDIHLPKMDLPSFLANGDYRAKAIMSNGYQRLGCVKATFSLHVENQWSW